MLYNSVRYNDPDAIPSLFPGQSFKLINPGIQIINGGFEFHSEGIGFMDNFDLLNTDSISLIGVFLYNNSDSPDPVVSPCVESFSTDPMVSDLLSPVRIKMLLPGEISSRFNGGSVKKALFTLALLDENKLPLSFSEILLRKL